VVQGAPLPQVSGVLLAAGAGRRAGGPKALRRDADGTSWLIRSAGVLLEGGCADVVVVLGCQAAAARELMSIECPPPPVERLHVVEERRWAEGMGVSLAAGLAAVAASGTSRAVLVSLVDLPDVTAEVVRRVLEATLVPGAATGGVLARACYHDHPGHPVLIGGEHLAALVAEVGADTGARHYLARAGCTLVECGDLASGEDRDGSA